MNLPALMLFIKKRSERKVPVFVSVPPPGHQLKLSDYLSQAGEGVRHLILAITPSSLRGYVASIIPISHPGKQSLGRIR